MRHFLLSGAGSWLLDNPLKVGVIASLSIGLLIAAILTTRDKPSGIENSGALPVANAEQQTRQRFTEPLTIMRPIEYMAMGEGFPMPANINEIGQFMRQYPVGNTMGVDELVID